MGPSICRFSAARRPRKNCTFLSKSCKESSWNGLSGATYATRADADPICFTRPRIADLVQSHLRATDAKHPLASPLHGQFSGMPATRIHVGDDEVLLDDSLRYVERAAAAVGAFLAASLRDT